MDKNYIHPDLETEVPKELRLEIYKKALAYYENEEYLSNKYNCDQDQSVLGLCLLLPCILWNLDDFLHGTSPDGTDWDYNHTPKAFPELYQALKSINSARSQETKIRARIWELKEILNN